MYIHTHTHTYVHIYTYTQVALAQTRARERLEDATLAADFDARRAAADDVRGWRRETEVCVHVCMHAYTHAHVFTRRACVP